MCWGTCTRLAARCLTALALGSRADAAPGIETVYAGTAHQALFAVSMRDKLGIAVGAHGEVRETADGGRSWKEVMPSPTEAALLGVALLPKWAIAVGQGGVVARRDSTGRWKRLESGTSNRLFAVDGNVDGVVVAVGAFGTTLKSVDFGAHWRSIAPQWASYTPQAEEPHLYAVQLGSDSSITIAGEFGLILRSVDGGDHWSAVHKGEASIFALQLRPDGQGYAVGQSGIVLKSANGGQTWTDTAGSSGDGILLGVQSFPGGRVIAVGMYEVLVSEDNGASWVRLGPAQMGTAWYEAVSAGTPDAPALLVGASGRIVRLSY
jgi:photosystem II stability/assembly factor-like uncharacterized protein